MDAFDGFAMANLLLLLTEYWRSEEFGRENGDNE